MTNKYPPGGVLFPNTNKRSDNAPDFSGNVEFDSSLLLEIQAQLAAGADRAKMDIAGWRRQKDGREFMSLKISAPYDKDRRSSFPSGGKSKSPDLDDEIPF